MHKLNIKAQNLFIIILGIILIIIIVAIIFINRISIQNNKDFIKENALRNPSQPSTQPAPEYYLPEPTAPNTKVQVDPIGARILLRNVMNRKPLTENQITVRENILQRYLFDDEESGTVYQSENIIINYVSGNTDAWEVSILTTSILDAKNEAVRWFINEGFDMDFICSYPVEFYLSLDAEEKIIDKNTTYDPLAPGCR